MKLLKDIAEHYLQQNDTPLQHLILEMAKHQVSRAEDAVSSAILS